MTPRGSTPPPRLDVRPLVRGGALTIGGTAASGVLQFALVVVATRGLGPEGAGVFFEATALFLIAGSAVEMGARTGLVWAVSRARAVGTTTDISPTVSIALWPVVTAAAVAAGTAFWLAPTIADALFRGPPPEGTVTFLRVLAPFLPVAAATSLLLSATRGFGTMVPFVGIQYIGIPVARLFLVGVAVSTGFGAAAVAAGWSAPTAVALVLAVLALRGLLRALGDGDEGPTPSPHVGSRFWRYSAPRGLAMLSDSVITWSDVILIGALASAREAGIYAAASRLALVGTYVLDAVGIAIAPVVSEMLATRRVALVRSMYRRATWWVMALMWPFHILMAVFAPVVLGVFGAAFPEGRVALVVLSLAMLVNVGTGNAHEVLVMAGKTSWNLVNTLAGAAVNVTLNVLLIPRFGMEGAAVAWAATIFAVNGLAVTQVWMLVGAVPFGNGYGSVALGAAACYGVLGLLARSALGSNLTALAVTVVAGTAAFAAFLWRVRAVLDLGSLVGAFRRPDGSAGAAVADGGTPGKVADGGR